MKVETMKSRILVPGLLFGLAASLFAATPRKLPLPQKPVADSVVGFTPDKGKFRILLQGSEAGSETFELSPSGGGWLARGDAVLRVPGNGETHATGQLRLAADGTPTHYEWTSQAPKKISGAVDFMNGTARTSIKLEGKDPVHEDFKFNSPRVAILDNNLYDQYAILARLYNWTAKGTQSIPVVIPQDMTPGSIDVEYVGPQSAGGAPLEVLRAHTSDLEIELYFDSKHHLMRLEVPAAKVVVVRQ